MNQDEGTLDKNRNHTHKCCTVQHFAAEARMTTSKNRLSVNLGSAEYAELQELAVKHNVSMAWVGRQAIIQLLEQYKQREFQFPLPLDTQQTGTRG